MNAPTCARRWQAEAADDRRLSDADRSSFERHVATCAICERAVREIELLRRVGASEDADPTSPLEHRRARNELLRRANELTLGGQRSSRPWLLLAAAAVVTLGGALAVPFLSRRAPLVPTQQAAVSPSYEMATSPDAEWATLEGGPTRRLELRRGRFELSVRRLAPGQRFILTLPDGELEVRGTRFVVEVAAGRTRSVQVHEGRVEVRVGERTDQLVLLGAGENFSATPTPTPTPTPRASSNTPPPLLLSSSPAPRAAQATTSSIASAWSSVPARPGPSAAARARAPEPTLDPSGGADFAAAMSAFSAGNYGEAERRFIAFRVAHPADPRAEDATFLSAVASARRGDAAGARAHAHRYLERYPNGLRRLEAARLAE